MKNFYKYLFFLVLGIIIYILLNDKDRFSIGIPPGTKFDFLPDDWPEQIRARHISQQVKFYELYEENHTEGDKKIVQKFIRYTSIVDREAPQEWHYGIEITFDLKVCAACKSCCNIDIYGNKPNSIKDFFKWVLPEVDIHTCGDGWQRGTRPDGELINDQLETRDLNFLAGIRLNDQSIQHTTNVKNNLFLDNPLVSLSKTNRIEQPYSVFNGKPKLTKTYQDIVMVLNSARICGVSRTSTSGGLRFIQNIADSRVYKGIMVPWYKKPGDDGQLVSLVDQYSGIIFSPGGMPGGIPGGGRKYWWTKYDPYLDALFWDTLITDLTEDQECMTPNLSLVSNFRLQTIRAGSLGESTTRGRFPSTLEARE